MEKRPLLVLAVLFTLVCVQHGFSQSNEVIDQLLEEEQATLGNTVYLVFLAADIAAEDWSVDRSIQELQSRGWGFDDAATDTVVDLGSMSFLLMKTFGMRGGIMYSLFPGRRYAARELAFLGFVPGYASPKRVLEGQEVTHILGRTLDHLGERGVAQ